MRVARWWLVVVAVVVPGAASGQVAGFAPATPVAQALPQSGTGWGATAVALRGMNGTRASFACPARGRAGSVWGDGTYTDDSSICTAAVHAGLLSLGGGGQVTIEVRAGLASYPGSQRNGISTASWPAWHGSFVIVGVVPGAAPPPGGPIPVSWSDDAAGLGAGSGPVAIDCPPGGSAGQLWGSGVYTDDSSLCTAAVHAGVITLAAGGRVDVELRPGQSSYGATSSNGVRSSSWGAWSGSFVVIGGVAPPAPLQIAGGAPIDWDQTAEAHRGRIGKRITVMCAPGGTPGTVWGSGVYTDDSSICSAALHAGRITGAGGKVTIEMVAGRGSYQGTTAHGVTTRGYGAWDGSFVIR